LCRRGMASGPGRGRSCKEQLSFLPVLHFSTTCAGAGGRPWILKRTSFWFGNRRTRINGAGDATGAPPTRPVLGASPGEQSPTAAAAVGIAGRIGAADTDRGGGSGRPGGALRG